MPKTKSYRLTDNRSGESFLLKVGKNGKLTIFDPDFKRKDGGKGARRAIRHCPNQKSIFMDEQDKHALVEPIIFHFGQLDVPDSEPITQQFLDNHPSNAVNDPDGGGWFEPVDDEMEAKESISDEELKNDIIYAVRQMAGTKDGIHELSAVAAVMLNSVEEASKMQIEQLKRVIYNEIDRNPHYFTDDNGNVNIFDDDLIKRKYLVLRAIKEGILKKNAMGRSMLWARDNTVIATAPRSIDLVDFFCDFLTTDEGMLVAEEIAKRS